MNSENRFGSGWRAPARAALLGVSACLMLTAASLSAAPVVVNLNYTTSSGTGTAVGTVTLDDSLLAPNTAGSVNCDLSLIYSFTLTVSGLPTSPSSTSFSKADLNGYYISTDDNGQITDLNFFMLNHICTPARFNADGYALDGDTTFIVGLYQNTGEGVPPEIASFEAAPAVVGPAIPTLSWPGLAALAMLILVAGALVAGRRLG